MEGAQWCSRVLGGSSQYNADSWSYHQAAGRPRVYPRYGDIHGAWAPQQSRGTHEWIELEFPNAAHVGGIEIYETYNPGAVVAVKVRSPTGAWEVVWHGAAERGTLAAASRIFSPQLAAPPYPVRHVRLELDTSGRGSYSEIDAVRLLPPVAKATPMPMATLFAVPVADDASMAAGFVVTGQPVGVNAGGAPSAPGASGRPLHELARVVEVQLGLSGTMVEVIEQACVLLGVRREGLNLIEAASACEAVLCGRGAASSAAVTVTV